MNELMQLKIENNNLKHKNADQQKQIVTLETRMLELEVKISILEDNIKIFERMWEDQRRTNEELRTELNEYKEVLKKNNLLN